ncbi:uncharacterized protein LOC127751028 [Frankliniella occidentalis]|uniref:Uncharacterized protein LOC127751028 n=1 Tax=Frankliniella occidentalis TaxID=133901 RepID=A0A9C6X6A3_FRAOC|nr:uncharacterized protein LOC127751028 [Frankliniella occidentalis]
MLKQAYDEDGDFVPFESWRDDKRKAVPHFAYWHTFLILQLTMLQFVRSIRSADFACYVETLDLIMPWFFALDHLNYARWGSVHVRDMANIAQTHPALAAEFRAGRFVGRNSSREFSGMALDQVHEQLNARMKGNSGMIGLTESPDTLLKWLLSGPDVAVVLEKFEEAYGMQQTSDLTLHHNDTAAANAAFRRDVKALRARFLERGNPFLETGEELFNIDSGRVVADKAALQAIMEIEDIGKRQYALFVQERLESDTKSLFDPISKNNFKLMKAATKKKVVTKVASLKNDVFLFSRLWITTHMRKGDMNEFFKHENQALPPSLTLNGTMRTGEKCEIVPALIEHTTAVCLSAFRPTVDAIVIDGAALVNMIHPSATCKTFVEYFASFHNYVEREMRSVSRVDLVFDVYLKDSLKNGTRDKRGEGQRMKVTLNSKLPTSWSKFMRDSQNKEDLFNMLADYLVDKDWNEKVLIVTRQSSCLSSTRQNPGENLTPCSHEEADTRMMLHAASAAANGCPRVLIRTVDSDVVVLAVWTASKVAMDELWLSYGVGKHQKFIAAHEIAKKLGPAKCEVLPAFHILTGCDITSSFGSVGKKTAFDTWMLTPDATEGLQQLSDGRLNEALPLLEKLVIRMYSKKCAETKLNSCRRALFQEGRQITSLPPTQDAFLQHCKRVMREVKVALQSLVPLPDVPSPDKCGWRRSIEGDWEQVWITLPEASKACKQLVSCKCKKPCKPSACSCLKLTKWGCSDLCPCPCPKTVIQNDTDEE